MVAKTAELSLVFSCFGVIHMIPGNFAGCVLFRQCPDFAEGEKNFRKMGAVGKTRVKKKRPLPEPLIL